jgi:hypothetical protein
MEVLKKIRFLLLSSFTQGKKIGAAKSDGRESSALWILARANSFFSESAAC